MPKPLHPEVIKHLSRIGAKGGRKGGKVSSPAKAEAARRNGKRPKVNFKHD